MALFCTAIKRDSVSLLRFPFLCHVQVFSFESSLFCCLKCPYGFSSNFCFLVLSVDAWVVCIDFGRSNQSSSAFFHVVFESLYWCIDAIFNPGKSPSSFFSWHIQSVYVICGIYSPMHRYEFSCSLVHLFQFLPCPLQEWSRISYNLISYIPLMRFLLYSLVSSSFLVLLEYSF